MVLLLRTYALQVLTPHSNQTTTLGTPHRNNSTGALHPRTRVGYRIMLHVGYCRLHDTHHISIHARVARSTGLQTSAPPVYISAYDLRRSSLRWCSRAVPPAQPVRTAFGKWRKGGTGKASEISNINKI